MTKSTSPTPTILQLQRPAKFDQYFGWVMSEASSINIPCPTRGVFPVWVVCACTWRAEISSEERHRVLATCQACPIPCPTHPGRRWLGTADTICCIQLARLRSIAKGVIVSHGTLGACLSRGKTKSEGTRHAEVIFVDVWGESDLHKKQNRHGKYGIDCAQKPAGSMQNVQFPIFFSKIQKELNRAA
jgi:hypothetical protein